MKRFIKGFFWFAFAAFLSASIPHVAYFFRAFEPQNAGQDLIWWGVSFAIAISIDITIFLLSVTVAELQRRGAAGSLIVSVWMMLLGLTVLSWYINYTYAQHFQTRAMVSSTPLPLPRLGTIADINPLIASMYQVLVIAYTWIADKIAQDEQPQTAAQVKAEADEVEQLLAQRKRLAAIKQESQLGGIGSFLKQVKTTVKDVLKDEQTEPQHERKTDGTETLTRGEGNDQNDDGEPVSSGGKTDEQSLPSGTVEPGKTDVKGDEQELQNGGVTSTHPLFAEVVQAYPETALWLATGQRTVTIEQIMDATKISKRRIRNRVNDGTLKRSPRNANRIVIMSVMGWLKAVQPDTQKNL